MSIRQPCAECRPKNTNAWRGVVWLVGWHWLVDGWLTDWVVECCCWLVGGLDPPRPVALGLRLLGGDASLALVGGGDASLGLALVDGDASLALVGGGNSLGRLGRGEMLDVRALPLLGDNARLPVDGDVDEPPANLDAVPLLDAGPCLRRG